MNWEWVRLGSIAQHNTGKTLDKGRNTGKQFEYITTSNVYWDGFELTALKEMPIEENNIDRFTVKKGDLLVCEGGDSGRSAIWEYERTVCFQNHVHRIRPYLNIETWYIYFFLYKIYLSKEIDQYKKGVGIQSLSGDALSSILLPLPPIKGQQRIVSEIKRCNNFVEIIELNQVNLQDAVKDTKSKILDLAIRGKLVPQDSNDEPASVLLERIKAERPEGKKKAKSTSDNSHYTFDIPKTWEWCQVSDFLLLLSGRDLLPSEYSDIPTGIPYIIGASNIMNDELIVNRWTNQPKVISEKNDLLITCKGTIGEIIINEIGRVHIARQLMAIRIFDATDIYYIRYCLVFYINQIKEQARGIIPGISREDILLLYIPVPPADEQKRIVQKIEEVFAMLDEIANTIKA